MGYRPANPPPELGKHVLAFSRALGAWWQAEYCPDKSNPAYQDDAWHLVGLDDGPPPGGWVITHWSPMPEKP